uniref:Testis expressed 36 n=1 Tax=Crocodylus porosus TaxID=8502 RepID=A0A7M4FX90_CROPO
MLICFLVDQNGYFVQNPEEAESIEKKLPVAYKIREQQAVNNFPFSSHDNKHCLQNGGEYFDFVTAGMGPPSLSMGAEHLLILFSRCLNPGARTELVPMCAIQPAGLPPRSKNLSQGSSGI